MIVVADTTPLLYLSRIGQVELLRSLYQQIVVPETVWREAVIARPDEAGVESLRDAAWIVISDQAERTGVEHSLEERRCCSSTSERGAPSPVSVA